MLRKVYLWFVWHLDTEIKIQLRSRYNYVNRDLLKICIFIYERLLMC